MSHIPVSSGRTWARAAKTVSARSVNSVYVVEAEDAPGEFGYFKFPSGSELTSLYSIGVERVAFSLAVPLGLPLPDLYLEEFEGKRGALSIEVGGQPWATVDEITLTSLSFLDANKWPLYIVFDIFLANIDRHDGNIFVDWDPPPRRRPREGEECATWLIDYGYSGLWPPVKFGPQYRGVDPGALPKSGLEIQQHLIHHGRNQMPPRWRTSFPLRGDPRREQALENVARITDDQIHRAVEDVPADYFSKDAADRTVALLAGRRDQIATLVDDVFPI